MSQLEGRRLKITTTFDWGGRTWLLDIGFDRDGAAREVFATGLQTGSAWSRTVSNFCILISLLLDDGGVRVADLHRRLTPTTPDNDRVAVPCMIETILAAALKVETEEGVAMREAWECALGLDPWRRALAARATNGLPAASIAEQIEGIPG